MSCRQSSTIIRPICPEETVNYVQCNSGIYTKNLHLRSYTGQAAQDEAKNPRGNAFCSLETSETQNLNQVTSDVRIVVGLP